MLASTLAYVYNSYTIAKKTILFGVYMKKRIAFLLVLVIALTVCIGTLAGCDSIIVRNEERDANQVVATVSYAGQTATIRKFELEISFNSYAYVYHTYYGMSYQATADYLLQSLAQRELLVLFVKDELVKMEGLGKAPADVSVESLLSKSERNRAVQNVNEDVLSAINSALASIISAKTPSSSDSSSGGTYEEYNGKDSITVRFNSEGGSAVERQRIKNGTVAYEPTDPTREGYTFYGWSTSPIGEDEAIDLDLIHDFNDAITLKAGEKSYNLYAVWKPYYEPRPVRETEAEDPDADYDPDSDTVPEEAPHAIDENGKLTDDYRALIESGEVELECLASYTEAKKEKYINDYLDEAVRDVVKDFNSLRTSYQYYLDNEMKTLLITRFERLLGESEVPEVTEAAVNARFQEMVQANLETFGGNRASYEEALTSALASTYYHEYTAADERYGFVINILLRLSDEDLAKLTEMENHGVYADGVVKAERDKLLRAMEIRVSNPVYDPDYVCDKHSCEANSGCDPMTCPNHECVGEVNEDADWNKIVEFVYDPATGEADIKYNVTACPSMAYLPGTVPAFDSGDVTGIVKQIYNSFEAVTAAVKNSENPLPEVLGVYWMRELATAWLYLVGDDSGGTSSDSNNGGLGYLITPEGEKSSYIDAFTEQGRALIRQGTGSYTNEEKGGGFDNSYVFGDNFIDTGSTSNAYAGIFILVATSVPFDTSLKGVRTDADGNAQQVDLDFNATGELPYGTLPLDYVIEYGRTLEDCVTIRQQIEDTLLSGRRASVYEEKVNAFGVAHYESNISYNREAYESLWEDLD